MYIASKTYFDNRFYVSVQQKLSNRRELR